MPAALIPKPFLSSFLIMMLFAFDFSTRAQVQPRELLGKTYGDRAPVLMRFYHDDLRFGDSLRVFATISDIKKLAAAHKDEDLLLETKLMRAHYFYYSKKVSAKRVLAMLDTLREEGRERQKIWLEAMAENMTALYYLERLKNYELGFEHHLQVYELIRGLSPAAFPYKQDCLKQIADSYYLFEEYPKSIYFNKEALKAQATTKMDLYPFPPNLTILNTIGVAYQKLGRLDSADHYFRQVAGRSRQAGVEIWEGIGNGNLGRNLHLKGRSAEARPYLMKELRAAEAYPDLGLAASTLTMLAEISLKLGDVGAADRESALAYRYIRQSRENRRLRELYPLMSKISALKQRPAMAALYLDSAIFVRDSLKDQMNAMKMLKATQRIDLERHRRELSGIESQRKLNLLERNALLVLLTIMAVGVVLVYRAQQKKHQWQRKKAKLAEEELAAAVVQLDHFARNLSEKNMLIEMLEQQKDGRDIEVLQRLQQSTILTKDDWTYFRGLFEKVHRGFFQRLKDRYPDLTPAEVRFMALSKLRLSTREMASMLGVGTDTIRQQRSRIRKKLGLNEDSNPEALAAEI